MLAILQRPTMGSRQPSEPDPEHPGLPFGYTIDASNNYFLMQPPEPAPGAPLLDANDARILDNFFDDINMNQFANTSFGEGLTFTEDWLNLPPTFVGSATSYGSQINNGIESSIHGLPDAAFGERVASPTQSPMHGLSGAPFGERVVSPATMMPPPLPHSQHAPAISPPPRQVAGPSTSRHMGQTTPEVLAAATALQNGRSQRVGSTSLYGPGLPVGAPVSLGHQNMMDFGAGPRMGHSGIDLVPHDEHGSTFPDMLYAPGPSAVRRPNNPVNLHWGSDSSFNNKAGFVPQSAKETTAAISDHNLSYMDCLEVNDSAETTRPSSPAAANGNSAGRRKTRVLPAHIKSDPDSVEPPRKRHKSHPKHEVDEEDEDDDESAIASLSRVGRKRKSKADNGCTTPFPDNPGKRRKSNANGASKTARENLTEEQKRSNHIKSEQKRRHLIKGGFEDLNDLVPGIKSGGFSKSTVLMMTADHLEHIQRDNERLRQIVDSLGLNG